MPSIQIYFPKGQDKRVRKLAGEDSIASYILKAIDFYEDNKKESTQASKEAGDE